MKELLELVTKLVTEIEEAVTNGVDDEEILDRLKRPGSVGRKLIDAIKSRRSKLDDFIANG